MNPKLLVFKWKLKSGFLCDLCWHFHFGKCLKLKPKQTWCKPNKPHMRRVLPVRLQSLLSMQALSTKHSYFWSYWGIDLYPRCSKADFWMWFISRLSVISLCTVSRFQHGFGVFFWNQAWVPSTTHETNNTFSLKKGCGSQGEEPTWRELERREGGLSLL